MKRGKGMGAQIRKLENTLTTVGTGIVVMAIWQTIKIILRYTLLSTADKDQETVIEIVVVIVTTILFGLIECYIGFSARAEGKRKKKSAFYLVLNGLYLSVFLVMLVIEIVLIFSGFYFTVSAIIITIIDITVFVLNIEMMISAIKVRRLRRLSAGGTV